MYMHLNRTAPSLGKSVFESEISRIQLKQNILVLISTLLCLKPNFHTGMNFNQL